MRSRSLVTVVALFLVASAAQVSWSAESPATLEDEFAFLAAEYTVESASRHEEKVSQAPASVTVITAEEFRRYGCRNIDDVLRAIIGLYVTRDRNYSYLGVRGFGLPTDYNSRVLLLIDGHRMNDPIYGQAAIGWESGIDLGEVDRIEVVRGPSSALYGSNAFFGIINVVTAKATDEAENEASLMLAEPGLTRVAGRARGGAGGVRYALDGYVMERKGHHVLQYPEFAELDWNEDGLPDYTGFAVDEDREEAHGFRARLDYGGLSLTGFFSSREKDVPTGSYETIFDAGEERSLDERSFVELAWQDAIGDSFSYSAKARYDKYLYKGWYPYPYEWDYSSADYTRPPFTVMMDDHPTSWWGYEVQADYTGLKGHRLTVGGSYNRNRADMDTYDVDPFYAYEDDRFSFFTADMYIQDEITFLETFRVVAGLNYNVADDDVFKGDVDRINPRVALIWNPRVGTTVKLMYGEAFKLPALFELYYSDEGLTQIANPELGPEVLKAGEIVLEQDLGGGFRVSLSAYRNVIEDLIEAFDTGDGVTQFQNNADDIVSSGIELSVNRSFGGRFAGYAAVAVQKTENDRTGDELPNSPNVLADAGLSWTLSEWAIASLSGRYVGERRGVDLETKTEEYVTADFTLLVTGVFKGLEASFSVYNLFDEDYADPGSFDHLQAQIPQDGRNYGLQITYRF